MIDQSSITFYQPLPRQLNIDSFYAPCDCNDASVRMHRVITRGTLIHWEGTCQDCQAKHVTDQIDLASLYHA